MSENIEDIPAERIVKIDPEGKYIIVFPEDTETEVMEDAADFFAEWWNDDSRLFCLLSGGAEIVKLEKP